MQSHVLNDNSRGFVWDRIWLADRYSRAQERLRRAESRFKAFALKNLASSEAKVLDVGCGSGDILSTLSNENRSQSLFGVDRSSVAIRLATNRHPKSTASYVCADIQSLPFSDEQFELVLIFGILEHVRNHQQALEEISRVLKKGGVVCISMSNAFSLLQIFNRVRALIGRYPYGYQKNWAPVELNVEVRGYFCVEKEFRMHAENDMPIVRLFDRALSAVFPAWSRYVCLVARKVGD